MWQRALLGVKSPSFVFSARMMRREEPEKALDSEGWCLLPSKVLGFLTPRKAQMVNVLKTVLPNPHRQIDYTEETLGKVRVKPAPRIKVLTGVEKVRRKKNSCGGGALSFIFGSPLRTTDNARPTTSRCPSQATHIRLC